MRNLGTILSLFAAVVITRPLFAATPTPAALSMFTTASREAEQRLQTQPCTFAREASSRDALRTRTVIEDMSPGDSSRDGALLHHWRAATFAPGARAADFERLLREFSAYPKVFAPDVSSTRVLNSTADTLLGTMRMRQHHVITVVLDATYAVRFGAAADGCGYSLSRSTRVDEIADPGSAREHPLSDRDNHGFLWRQDVFWSYVERDGGLYLQIETLSLSRGVPTGLGWAVRPFLDSVPRESLAFTLASAVRALCK